MTNDIPDRCRTCSQSDIRRTCSREQGQCLLGWTMIDGCVWYAPRLPGIGQHSNSKEAS